MKPSLPALLLALATPFLGACGSAAPPEPERPRLVMLVATCSVNRSFLSPYAEEIPYTPQLQRFADEGVVFERHRTESGQSGTSFASIFSGRQAYGHGVYCHPKALDPSLYLVGEAFADAGFETWFWNGHPMGSIELAYGQGIPPERSFNVRSKRAKHTMLREGDRRFTGLLDGLVSDPEKHAFVLANFTVTHSPYPKQISTQEVLDFIQRWPARGQGLGRADLERWFRVYDENRFELQWDYGPTVERLRLSADDQLALQRVLQVTYEAMVERLDRGFGEMLAAIEARGLLEDALIVLTADHGELLFRDNALFQWTHGLQLADEVLDVPWIVRGPGLAPGRHAEVTRSIDVFPTLAGLVGIEIPPELRPEGEDLGPVLRGEAEAPRLLAYSHTTTIDPPQLEQFADYGTLLRWFPRTDPELVWTAVRDRDELFLLRPYEGFEFEPAAFDLATDPERRKDIFDPGNARHAEMHRKLERYKGFLVEAYGKSSAQAVGDAAARAALEDLGYIGDD